MNSSKGDGTSCHLSLEVSPALQLKSFQECMKSAWQPAKWLKFLSGRSKIGIAGALRMFVQRWRLRRDSGHHTAVRTGAAPPDGFPSHPSHEDLPGDPRSIRTEGRHIPNRARRGPSSNS